MNALNVPILFYGLYAAYRWNPHTIAICPLLSAGLKLWFVDKMMRYYERHRDDYRVSRDVA